MSAFTDDDLNRLKEKIIDGQNDDSGVVLSSTLTLKALLARLEGDEQLLDRAIERMKSINGPDFDCIISDWKECQNHKWIHDAESWRKTCGK